MMLYVVTHLPNNYVLNFQHQHNPFVTDISEREEATNWYCRESNESMLSGKPWLWTGKSTSTKEYIEAHKCYPNHVSSEDVIQL